MERKIHSFSMYAGEVAAAKLKLLEEAHWVDESWLYQANRTFKNSRRRIVQPPIVGSALHHRVVPVSHRFRSGWSDRFEKPWWINRSNCHWRNEAYLRNLAQKQIRGLTKSDVIVLSDVDEIIDRRAVPKVLEAVSHHGIVTVGLRLTHYFCDCMVQTWPGPEDYSYRVFVATVEAFLDQRLTVDQLRKKGEAGLLVDSVHRVPGYSGFHHSWLGDEGMAVQKIMSYSHKASDHSGIVLTSEGRVSKENVILARRRLNPLFDGISVTCRENAPRLLALSELPTQERDALLFRNG